VIDDVFGLDELLIIIGTIHGLPVSRSRRSPSSTIRTSRERKSAPADGRKAWSSAQHLCLAGSVKSKALGWLCKLIGFSGTFATTVSVPFNPTTAPS
jgi:hypothetical protein